MAPADLANRGAPHVRVPKLAYRNPLPADQTSLSSCKSSTSETLPSSPEDAEFRLSASTSNFSSVLDHPSFEVRSVTSSSLASDASSSSKESKATKKKKAGSVLGFLTLKEPSQSAFEQYAEQERKKAAGKGGKNSPVASAHSSIISAKKLPPNIPKVNSKWDGIPESVKAAKDSPSKKRYSNLSQSTTIRSGVPNPSVFSLASNTSHGPPNSLASGASSLLDEPYDPSSRSFIPSTSSLPEMTYFFPDNGNPSGMLPGSSVELSPQSPHTASSASRSIDSTSSRTSTIDESAIIALTTPPLLTNPTSDVHAEAKELYRKLSTKGFLAGEAQEYKLPDEDNDSDASGEDTHDFLFATPTQVSVKDAPLLASDRAGGIITKKNFSRPLSNPNSQPPTSSPSSYARPALRNSVSRLPTLYEASITSVDTNATITETTIDTTTMETDTTDIADTFYRSASIDSFTPSEMSASWYRSPRERLGLGGRVRKTDVLPWELDEPPQQGKRKKNPLAMVFTKGIS
ncbi:hypothetical protein B0J11DRAFT_436348 [Dendryphion nanum]|uniref:Uncharacterized protein n=1 Tax=Dendryphion nanum TaxID=256645 RepID=A0A9P9IM16_9PLEO|nr:hypothetical protein B0J11DRAFT_436348 [Dendryphion nanum]